MKSPHLIVLLLLASSLSALRAGSGEEDWQAIVALDAGPQVRTRTPAELQLALGAHLSAQEKALRSFLAAHPDEPRVFEARLRLVRVLGLRGEMLSDGKARAEAGRLLESLAQGATAEQQVEVDFLRLAQAMRRVTKPTQLEREALLTQVKRFQARYPEDRRLAALLAETATLFDRQPKTKTQLLRDARGLARDEELQARIADDLRRLEALGQVISFSAPAIGGGTFNLSDYRGKVVLLAFFALWSEPSLEALTLMQKAAAAFPKDRLQLLGVSLDSKPEALAGFLKEKAIAWPVACDSQGWESPLVRSLGVNALPTVWLLDGSGKLRALNVLENPADQIRQVLAER